MKLGLGGEYVSAAAIYKLHNGLDGVIGRPNTANDTNTAPADFVIRNYFLKNNNNVIRSDMLDDMEVATGVAAIRAFLTGTGIFFRTEGNEKHKVLMCAVIQEMNLEKAMNDLVRNPSRSLDGLASYVPMELWFTEEMKIFSFTTEILAAAKNRAKALLVKEVKAEEMNVIFEPVTRPTFATPKDLKEYQDKITQRAVQAFLNPVS